MKMTMRSINEILKSKIPSNPLTEGGLPKRPVRGKKTRFFIDNEFLANGYAALFHRKRVFDVYAVLTKYANYRTQICFPSVRTIMKETGIKNRNTVHRALKILEQYQIIAVVHSKGKRSNRYALLDARAWKEPNSINIDTVDKTKINPKTVSEEPPKLYQNEVPNSITGDTRNLITKSNKEILDNKPLNNHLEEEKDTITKAT